VSDLALAGMLPLPVELAAPASLPGVAAAAFDSEAVAIAPGVPMGEATPDPAPAAAFHALLRELAGQPAQRTGATGANKREPEIRPEGPRDEERNKVGIAAAPLGLDEFDGPAEHVAEMPAAQPATANGCASALARQESRPSEAPRAPDEPAQPDVTPGGAKIKPPPGFNVREQPQAPVAERMRVAFAVAVERQSGPGEAAPGDPQPPRATEPSPQGEASGKAEAAPAQASAARVHPVTQANPAESSAAQPEGVTSGNGGALAASRSARAQDSPPAPPVPETASKPLHREPGRAEPVLSGARQRDRAAQQPTEPHRLGAAQPPSAAPVEARGPGEATAPRQIVPPPEWELRPPEPPAHEISLRVEADPAGGRTRSPVAVHVVERAGRIEIRVRSADPQLNQWLRRDVPALMDRLEAEGFRGEILPAPADGETAGTGLSRLVAPHEWAAPDGEGPRHGGAHPDPQQHRPRPQGNAPEEETGPGEMSAFRRLHDGFLG